MKLACLPRLDPGTVPATSNTTAGITERGVTERGVGGREGVIVGRTLCPSQNRGQGPLLD
jgi:hypothetical protein